MIVLLLGSFLMVPLAVGVIFVPLSIALRSQAANPRELSIATTCQPTHRCSAEPPGRWRARHSLIEVTKNSCRLASSTASGRGP